jgi:type VI secretion system (T6SS) effector TldE1-like protein
MSWASTIGLALMAFVVAAAVAAWMTDSDEPARVAQVASPTQTPPLPFAVRFSQGSAAGSLSTAVTRRDLAQSAPSDMARFVLAERLLAQKLLEQAQSGPHVQSEQIVAADRTDEPVRLPTGAVPLPRARPLEASWLESQSGMTSAQTDGRLALSGNTTLMQKLSGLLPPRITLASLSPDGGLGGDRPDLAALGYDSQTAVYDISAHAVYMPGGSTLEAHSGFGHLMDNPKYVNVRDVGATPPQVYDLKPRAQLFHGIQALRMIPVDSNGTLGRTGLLAHGYMLGPNGDSNGCVSIKDYEKFLKAYQNGEVTRLVVVASLS